MARRRGRTRVGLGPASVASSVTLSFQPPVEPIVTGRVRVRNRLRTSDKARAKG